MRIKEVTGSLEILRPENTCHTSQTLGNTKPIFPFTDPEGGKKKKKKASLRILVSACGDRPV